MQLLEFGLHIPKTYLPKLITSHLNHFEFCPMAVNYGRIHCTKNVYLATTSHYVPHHDRANSSYTHKPNKLRDTITILKVLYRMTGGMGAYLAQDPLAAQGPFEQHSCAYSLRPTGLPRTFRITSEPGVACVVRFSERRKRKTHA